MSERFTLRVIGNKSCYFDSVDDVELSSDQVLDALNSGERARNQRDHMHRKISEALEAV